MAVGAGAQQARVPIIQFAGQNSLSTFVTQLSPRGYPRWLPPPEDDINSKIAEKVAHSFLYFLYHYVVMVLRSGRSTPVQSIAKNETPKFLVMNW